jgi:hypothetical protein
MYFILITKARVASYLCTSVKDIKTRSTVCSVLCVNWCGISASVDKDNMETHPVDIPPAPLLLQTIFHHYYILFIFVQSKWMK